MKIGRNIMRKRSGYIDMVARKSKIVDDVDVLLSGYEDKAFVYNTGNVEILKEGKRKRVKFPSKKAAVFYLMKTGWNYV